MRLGEVTVDTIGVGRPDREAARRWRARRFDDATAAAEGALDLLVALPRAGLPTAHAGVAAGPLIVRDGDVFGRTGTWRLASRTPPRTADSTRPSRLRHIWTGSLRGHIGGSMGPAGHRVGRRRRRRAEPLSAPDRHCDPLRRRIRSRRGSMRAGPRRRPRSRGRGRRGRAPRSDGVQSNCHDRQAHGPRSARPTVASAQVAPSSTETSTPSIAAPPDQTRPVRRQVPMSTTRRGCRSPGCPAVA